MWGTSQRPTLCSIVPCGNLSTVWEKHTESWQCLVDWTFRTEIKAQLHNRTLERFKNAKSYHIVPFRGRCRDLYSQRSCSAAPFLSSLSVQSSHIHFVPRIAFKLMFSLGSFWALAAQICAAFSSLTKQLSAPFCSSKTTLNLAAIRKC